nr:MAG TPA: hypothetical protein [Caudoviricetes sp.]
MFQFICNFFIILNRIIFYNSIQRYMNYFFNIIFKVSLLQKDVIKI